MARSLFARLTERYAPDRSNRISRRDLLKASLAASASLLLSSCTHEQNVATRPSAPRVAVIGAGFAGLVCASELLSVGYDVIVFDARKRVGGRVLSIHDFAPGYNVEGGGELIGSNHPLWVRYASELQLAFLDVSDDKDTVAPLALLGRHLDDKAAKEIWEGMDTVLATMTQDASPVNSSRPWESDQAQLLDEKSAADWLAAINASPLVKAAIEAQIVANNGVSLKKQSYLGNLAMVKGGGLEKYWTDSEVYRCKGGNIQLAQHLADKIGAGRIQLEKPVTAIEIGSSGVTITTADGDRIVADEVVLAVPPSTWDRIRIDLPLPPSLRPQMGLDVKYLSLVKSRFWNEAHQSPDALTDGPIAMTWEGTDGQPDVDGRAVLTAFTGAGGAAQSLAAADSDAFIQSELSRIYDSYSSHFIRGRFMAWPREKWTMAAYSFPAPGEVTSIGPMLDAGIQRLHFAGEHCSPAFVGYMEGALQSGAKTARNLARQYGSLG